MCEKSPRPSHGFMRLFLSLSSREIGKKLIKKTFIYVTFFRDRGVIGETVPVLRMTDDILKMKRGIL